MKVSVSLLQKYPRAVTFLYHSSERILGRCLAVDVKHPVSGDVMFEAGTLLDEVKADAIETAGIGEVKIRSVLTCETKGGVCGKCYGRDLARGTPGEYGRGCWCYRGTVHR